MSFLDGNGEHSIQCKALDNILLLFSVNHNTFFWQKSLFYLKSWGITEIFWIKQSIIFIWDILQSLFVPTECSSFDHLGTAMSFEPKASFHLNIIQVYLAAKKGESSEFASLLVGKHSSVTFLLNQTNILGRTAFCPHGSLEMPYLLCVSFLGLGGLLTGRKDTCVSSACGL